MSARSMGLAAKARPGLDVPPRLDVKVSKCAKNTCCVEAWPRCKYISVDFGLYHFDAIRGWGAQTVTLLQCCVHSGATSGVLDWEVCRVQPFLEMQSARATCHCYHPYSWKMGPFFLWLIIATIYQRITMNYRSHTHNIWFDICMIYIYIYIIRSQQRAAWNGQMYPGRGKGRRRSKRSRQLGGEPTRWQPLAGEVIGKKYPATEGFMREKLVGYTIIPFLP